MCFRLTAAAAAKSLQSCPTLCDPIDGSPPGFPVPGILQARTLEWVAISFSNARKWKVKVKSLSCVRLLATPWIAAYQAPLTVFHKIAPNLFQRCAAWAIYWRLCVCACVCVCVCVCARLWVLSYIRLLATTLSVDHQVPLSMELPRQEYWNGLPFPLNFHTETHKHVGINICISLPLCRVLFYNVYVFRTNCIK